MRVLLIEDHPDILLICRLNLELSGHEVLEASDGEQGMELALSLQPDIIVLDLMLPRQDGMSTLREFQMRQETQDIPVVLLTAKAQRDDQIRGWESGCAGYITKPFSPPELTELLAEIHAMSVEDRSRRKGQALAGLREDG